ncbi:MAG TPA: hypothetical protein VFS27_10735 [Blastocatellia bacterium]|jgi:hypothetical protein|nr:hypothetical protein [Blastocatellia bacterium]
MITQIKHPSRAKGLMMAVIFSVLAHAVIVLAIRISPIVRIVMGFRDIEYVEDVYDKGILVKFTKRLEYPRGYAGFRAPQKAGSLDDLKKEEARRRRLEARRKRERELAEKRAAEERAKAEEQAKAAEKEAQVASNAGNPGEPKPTPTPSSGYGSFGKINTKPIKDQIQRLYQAKIDGVLKIPDSKFKVGVQGSVNPDGTLAKYSVHISSGIPEIDESAMAILAAVSESRALGPLSRLTSITMVLTIDQNAELTVTGVTKNEDDAKDLKNLADFALFAARIKKGEDQTAMVMLNNLKVKRTGTRIDAVITVPKEMAKQTLDRSMEKK